MNKILSSTALLAAFALSGVTTSFGAAPASLSIDNLFGPDSEMTFRLNIKEIKESNGRSSTAAVVQGNQGN